MKNTNKTVTIGISAFNEEANIKNLLFSVLEQKGDFRLEKIVVISDGSTDNTTKFVKEVSNPRITVIDNDIRKGKSERQNEICAMAESDILVILDADILPADDLYISKLIDPIIKNSGVGLTSGETLPINPKSFFEKILAFGLSFRIELFESIRPDNVYLCVGPSRAFSKDFYKKIKWPSAYPEDTYSYLRAIELGFKFKYQKSAKVFLKLPDNLGDHFKQSRRFMNSPVKIKSYFDEKFVSSQHNIPKKLFISKMLKYFMRNPFLSIAYLMVSGYPRIFKQSKSMKNKWDMSISTKKLTN